MVYHVIRRPSSNQIRKSSIVHERSDKLRPISVTKLMPRYHYSRATLDGNTNNKESILAAKNLDESSNKIQATLSSVTDENGYGPLQAAFVPIINHNRSTTPKRREFVSIPITRENANSSVTSNSTRSVPVTYINETTNILPSSSNQINANSIHLLRPSSRYFQYHMNQRHGDGVTTVTVPSLPRLSSGSRRLSLTLPVTINKSTNVNSTNTDENDTKKNNLPTTSSNARQIPIRLPQTPPIVSIPSINSRISSAVLQAAPVTTSFQRQQTDFADDSTSNTTSNLFNDSDFNVSSPTRQIETFKDSIPVSNRVQHQIRYRNNPTSNPHRSPSQSRRVIINLQNNQCVPLDARLSNAMKPPVGPSASPRSTTKNNLYYIPVLHEIQIPSDSSTEFQSSSNFKNEFHVEIPVTISKTTDQENQDDDKYETDDGTSTRDPTLPNHGNSNQTLKSILKRSSSRDTVARKNVSFVNA